MMRTDNEEELLRSVALQTASSVLVARQHAERRNEAYLAEAQRLSHTGSFGWRVSSGELFWSEETFRIFQYEGTTTPTPEHVLNRVHPDDLDFVKQTVERASKDGRDYDHEYRLVMPDRSVKHLHVVAHAYNDQSGGVEFVGAVTDITESKQAQEALRRSERNLAEAQRLTHTGSWAWRGAGGDALHLSEEWYRIYGFDPKQGMPAWEQRLQRTHPEDRAKWQGTIERAIREKSDYELEFRILIPDGTIKHIHTVGHPVLNASGDLAEFVGSATDVTERKRGEVLLAGEKRLLEMIVKGDPRSIILEAACLLVEELASSSLSSILLYDPNANCLRHGAAPSLPVDYMKAIDGIVIGPSVGSCGTAAYRAEPVIVSDIATDPLWVDFRELAFAHGLRACWSSPILSSRGKVLGTFAIYYREPRNPMPQEYNVIEQITHLASIAVERELVEEALHQARAELAHVARVTTLGELTASIAHEVNQPLAAIATNGEACMRFLNRGVPDLAEIRDAVTCMINDSHRAGEVIKRLRAMSKKDSLQKLRLDINDVINEALLLVQRELSNHRVALQVELSSGLAPVVGDRVQLQQVVINLVMNGIDALALVAGRPRELLIRSGPHDANQVLVAVQDSGVGIDPEKMDQLFDAFFTTKPTGMGMGLSICRSIIEAHGGRISASNNSGAGATFKFTLPLES
jgi:PAS domain S-box-containing protein